MVPNLAWPSCRAALTCNSFAFRRCGNHNWQPQRIWFRCIDGRHPDRYVATHRRMMTDVKQKVALSSIAASAGLTTAKGIVGVMSGSLALLSEAAHSLIDLGATVMTYFAVRTSGKPADAEHHYGHGKIESVSALAETALLFILAGIVIWEAAKRLLSAQPPEVVATPWAFAVITLSIVVDFLRARVLRRTAEETSSPALEADALHYDSDMWSSLAVLVGLFGIALGYASADSVAAIAVSLVICIAGWRLGRRTIDTLTETARSRLTTSSCTRSADDLRFLSISRSTAPSPSARRTTSRLDSKRPSARSWAEVSRSKRISSRCSHSMSPVATRQPSASRRCATR